MCEDTITSFLRQRFGFERIPVPTEAVTMLIERDAADLDVATDLSDDIHEVFGFTQFERGRKPLVTIARELWEQRHRNNRLRTTLTHEYGHVMLHTWLYDKYGVARGPHRCYWQSLLPTGQVMDWFEWQAGYASGALLMPESFARRMAGAYFQAARASAGGQGLGRSKSALPAYFPRVRCIRRGCHRAAQAARLSDRVARPQARPFRPDRSSYLTLAINIAT